MNTISSFVSGDSVSWLICEPEFPASSGWVLSLRAVPRNAGAAFNLSSAASGDNHAVNLTAVQTAAYAAGQYSIIPFFSRGTDRFTKPAVAIEIKPNLANATSFDNRVPSRIIADQLRDAYAQYIARGQGHVSEYEIANRRMKFRSSEEILQQINHFENLAQREEIAAGQRPQFNRQKIQTRFL